jgi:hypothetical protein
VTVQVLTFALSDLLTGVGRLALICPDARTAQGPTYYDLDMISRIFPRGF